MRERVEISEDWLLEQLESPGRQALGACLNWLDAHAGRQAKCKKCREYQKVPRDVDGSPFAFPMCGTHVLLMRLEHADDKQYEGNAISGWARAIGYHHCATEWHAEAEAFGDAYARAVWEHWKACRYGVESAEGKVAEHG